MTMGPLPITRILLMSSRRHYATSSRVSSELPTGQAVGRDVDVQVVPASLHEAREGGEQVVGVGGPGPPGWYCTLKAGTSRKAKPSAVPSSRFTWVSRMRPKALVGHDGGGTPLRPHSRRSSRAHSVAPPESSGISAPRLFGRSRGSGPSLHAAGEKVLHRVVAAVMAELQLVDLGTRGLGHHLWPRQMPNSGTFPSSFSGLSIGLLHRLRVTRAVGEEHAVGVHRQHVFGRRVPGHHSEFAARGHQPSKMERFTPQW